MIRFRMYRDHVPTETHDKNQANSADESQFEGVIFEDKRVVVHWLTAVGSISVFDSYQDLMKIHGHPEYGSRLVWIDEQPRELTGYTQDEPHPYTDCLTPNHTSPWHSPPYCSNCRMSPSLDI